MNRVGCQRHFIGRVARMVRRARHKVADERGVAAIEFALILPFLLILMLGSIELFLMSMASRKVGRLTNTVGDLVAQAPSDITKADIQGYYKAAKYILGNLPTENLALTIYVFKKNATGEPTVRWTHHIGTNTCQEKAPSLDAMQKKAMVDGNDLVLTFSCYTYPIKFGKIVLANASYTLRSQVILRPRRQLTLACTDCS